MRSIVSLWQREPVGKRQSRESLFDISCERRRRRWESGPASASSFASGRNLQLASLSEKERERLMSDNSKLQTALRVVFILATAGAIGVSAQTQTAVGSYPTSTMLRADSTNESKKTKAPKWFSASTENPAPDKSAESNGEKDSNVIRRASAPLTTTERRSETKTAPRGPQAVDDDKWQFQVTPYFWLASLHGTAGVGNRTTDVQESFSDIFHTLKFAFMGVLEARKGKIVVLTDLEYVSIEDDRATPGPLFSNTTAKFKTFILDPEVGYRVWNNPDKGGSLDVLGGARITHLSTQLNFGAGILPAQQLDGSRTWVDGIGGVRGKVAVSEKVFVTAKADMGGGGSKFTYQLFGGAGYNVTPKIALIGGYRVLDVNYAKNNFIYNMNQRGPILGLGFKF